MCEMTPSVDTFQQDAAHDYNFMGGGIYDESSDNIPSTDDELLNLSTRHSSVSSFPASVVHHAPTTPTKSHYARATTPTYSPRPHSTGFRHPSSVRALQMQDEFEFTEYEMSHHRRPSKLSARFSGSYHSSPTKSIRTRSARGQKVKEFPLVLLHCTLLPPTLTIKAKALKSNDKESVLEAIIPEPYVQRWRTLQDKVVKNSEVKLRGLLIPHPRDEYELLEERLLESLELERPRIRDGHYLDSIGLESVVDSGFESGGTDSDSLHEGIPSVKCPDCGHKVSHGTEQERKWEVKVFAANGLMRAGAWGAAWSEMEKIDVEVGVWMPEEVRREVDARLDALIAKEQQESLSSERKRRDLDDERANEIYGMSTAANDSTSRSQAEIDGLEDTSDPVQASFTRTEGFPISEPRAYHPTQPDIATLLWNYFQLLAQDRRNIAILLLSMLVVFYGVSSEKFAQSNDVGTGTVSVSSSSLLQPGESPTAPVLSANDLVNGVGDINGSGISSVTSAYSSATAQAPNNLEEHAIAGNTPDFVDAAEEESPTTALEIKDVATTTLANSRSDPPIFAATVVDEANASGVCVNTIDLTTNPLSLLQSVSLLEVDWSSGGMP